jgi:hypothetical protein
MWRIRPLSTCLETQAASAGLALACAYSGSDEYESSVIARRRDAGAYSSHQQPIIPAAAAIAAALLFFFAV